MQAATLLRHRETDSISLALNVIDGPKIGLSGGDVWVSPVSRSDTRLCLRMADSEKAMAGTIQYIIHKVVRSFFSGLPTGLSWSHHEQLIHMFAQSSELKHIEDAISQLRSLI